MEYYTLTDIGRKRNLNEDQSGHVVSACGKVEFFFVSDGMGGEEGGETASEIVVSNFERMAKLYNYTDEEELKKFIRKCVLDIDEQIVFEGVMDESIQNMGATFVCVAVIEEENKVIFTNVGDSRAYLFRNYRLTKITKDHNMYEKMVDFGIDPEIASKMKDSAALIRVVGHLKKENIEDPCDFFVSDISLWDRMLLCSDGLTNEISEEALEEIFRENEGPKQCAEVLMARALETGGRDNITLTVINF